VRLLRYSKTSFTKIFDLYFKAPPDEQIYHAAEQIIYRKLHSCWITHYLLNDPCHTYCPIKLLITVRGSLQSRYLQFMSKAPFKLSTWQNRSSFYNPSLYTNVSTLGNTAILFLILLTLTSFCSHLTQTLYSNTTNYIAHDWLPYRT